MPVKTDMSGLKKFSDNLQELSAMTEVSLEALLTAEFIKSCSSFQDAEHMLSSSDFRVETPEDFAAIPDAEWEEFIIKNTKYSSWQQMLDDAMSCFVDRQLTKGM